MHQNSVGRSRGRGHPIHSGPLLTEHLRVEDLDLELEVLKHKRELVERERQKLTLERDTNRKRQYEQMNRNVSNTFGNIWQASSPKHANALQQPHPWIDTTQNSFASNMPEPMPAHYIPPLLGPKINLPFPSSIKPIVHPLLSNTFVQRHGRPMAARKGFRNYHGVKKIRKEPQSKLNTYPVLERKNLVSKATGSQLAKTQGDVSSVNIKSMILREGRIPSNQVTGRLELALGTLVKDMCFKSQNDTVRSLELNLRQRRTIKQLIRERIRAVMLNKPVGSVVDIINRYRQKFPLTTDRDLIDSVVISSADDNCMNSAKTESPEEFFKRSISSLLTNKVEEMCSNLLKIYSDVGDKKLTCTKLADGNKKASEKKSIAYNEATAKVLRTLTGKNLTTEENDILTTYYTKLIEDILQEKLPEYLPKCKEQFLKIFDMDSRFKTIMSIATKKATIEIMKKKSNLKEQNERNPETSDNKETQEMETDHDIEMEEEVATKNNEIEEVTVNDNNEVETEADPKSNESEKTVTENSEIDNDVIIVLDNDVEAKSGNVNNDTVTATVTENNDVQKETLFENIPSKEVIAEADTAKEISIRTPIEKDVQESSSIPTSLATSSEQQISESINPTVHISKGTKPAGTITPTTPMTKKIELSSTPKTPVVGSFPLPKELPYYVKLIGRPTLPDRAVICDFLNNYAPTSIKKHKSISNLLVVGFIDQDAYSRILKANETVIGDITIIIKGNEKVNAGKANESLNDSKKHNSDNVVKELKEEVKADQEAKDRSEICKEVTYSNDVNKSDEGSDLIGKELDDQITDLLSNIKKGDEDTTNSNTLSSLETIQETEGCTTAAETVETDTAAKVPPKSNVKESGRSTPVRPSRLGNVTPSTIRTRRSSRLMQE